MSSLIHDHVFDEGAVAHLLFLLLSVLPDEASAECNHDDANDHEGYQAWNADPCGHDELTQDL